MVLPTTRNYFELFQLSQRYALDSDTLDRRYLELQTRVHPDRAAHLSDAEKRLYLQWATLTNEAYRTLKRPLDRARYLLRLHGVNTREEDNTAMPAEFLLEQIEWREELQQAITLRSQQILDRLELRVRQETERLLETLTTLLDVEGQLLAAADVVRQLAFLEKLQRDIDQAQGAWED
jgi:molecular chaperone HscB